MFTRFDMVSGTARYVVHGEVADEPPITDGTRTIVPQTLRITYGKEGDGRWGFVSALVSGPIVRKDGTPGTRRGAIRMEPRPEGPPMWIWRVIAAYVPDPILEVLDRGALDDDSRLALGQALSRLDTEGVARLADALRTALPEVTRTLAARLTSDERGGRSQDSQDPLGRI